MIGPERPVVHLTGASGFIGSHVAARLLERGAHLVTLSRGESPPLSDTAVRVRGSLESITPDEWVAAGVDRCDILVHLAAFIPKSASDGDDVEAVFRDNLVGTRRLLESLPTRPARLILASTTDVYAASDELITEESALGPRNLYAASKVFCERLFAAFARHHQCTCCILRFGSIFGPGEDAFEKIIPTTLRKVSEGSRPVIFGNGQQLRDVLFVGDAAEATVRAAFCRLPDFSIVNVVSGQPVNVGQIVELALKAANRREVDVEMIPVSQPLPSVRYDNTRLRELLGEWEFVDLEEGLRREVQYLRRRTSR